MLDLVFVVFAGSREACIPMPGGKYRALHIRIIPQVYLQTRFSMV